MSGMLVIYVGKAWYGFARLESIPLWQPELFKLFLWVQHSACIQSSVSLESNLILWSNVFCAFFSLLSTGRNLGLGCRSAPGSWSAECPYYWGQPKVRGNSLCSIWYKSHKQQNCRVRNNSSSLPAILSSSLLLHRNFCSVRETMKNSPGFKNTWQTCRKPMTVCAYSSSNLAEFT